MRPSNSSQRIALILACSLALGAIPSLSAGQDGKSHFQKMDLDGDGKVTRAEHASAAKQMFTRCDANHDGEVTATEMDAAMLAEGKQLKKDDKTSAEKIKVIDQNSDGKLTAAEHEAGTEKMFAKMDTNGDGWLSKEECDESMKMMKKDH